tara:strand:- start:16981 stop:17910 length:930 start_codon:yes stop_codon:yes gene_type:complete
MPTFNQAEYIRSAIASVLAQDYSLFELIIIDNYSRDGTFEVINSFNDERIKYLQFNNQGVIAAARNYGVKYAQGSILAFLDSDDIWREDMLSSQLTLLSDDIGLVSSCFLPIGNVIRCKNHLKHIRHTEQLRMSYMDLIHSNSIMTSSVVMRKDVFVRAGGFDESIDFRFIEDWELWLRVAAKKDFFINGKTLLQYRISSKTDRDLRDVKLRTLLIIQKNFDMGLIDDSLFKQLQANCYVDIGKAFLDMNDRNGIDYYRRSLRFSIGLTNKVRALGGLGLFYVPSGIRVKLIGVLYMLNSKLSQLRKGY